MTTPETKHRCAAVGCNEEVPAARLMCRSHWFMVPLDIRRTVWAAYDHGPLELLRAAQQKAIKAVAEKEGKAC